VGPRFLERMFAFARSFTMTFPFLRMILISTAILIGKKLMDVSWNLYYNVKSKLFYF
jgi:hypothetical protein